MVLFLGLSILCMYLYSQVVYRVYGPPVREGGTEDYAAGEADMPPPEPVRSEQFDSTTRAAKPVRDSAPQPVGQSITVETDLYRSEWTTVGGRLRSLHLKKYRSELAADSPGLDLVDIGADQRQPIGLMLAGTAFDDTDVVYQVDRESLVLSGDDQNKIVFETVTSTGLDVRKEMHFLGNSYPINVLVVAEGPGAQEIDHATVQITHEIDPGADSGGGWLGGGSQGGFLGVLALNGKRLEQEPFSDLEKPVVFPSAHWAGFGDQYFITVGLTEAAEGTRAEATRDDADLASVDIELPMEGSPRQAELMLYFGPKDVDILEQAAPSLERAVDFGYFWFVALPLLRLLKALHKVTGNYGVDIILLSTLIKVVFLPLTRKSMTSMQEMQKLQPQMAKIKERYKDDMQQQQKEMMELYKRHHVNPLSGCLPMLLQLPMFIGLYNALLNAIELRHAPFVGWITDLSAPERLHVMGVPVPMLAIAMGASMLAQQWMTPATGDPTQRRIMMIMPVMFTFMFINFPSGLVLYWLVNNLLTITQQYFLVNRTAG
jgi:YidC/Oxa1 family membrane protein insertase